MTPVNYLALLKLAMPEALIVAIALVVLLVDLGVMRAEARRYRLFIATAVTAFGCFAAIMWILNMPVQANVQNGMLVVNPLTQLIKLILLLMAFFTAVISMNSTFTEHVGEYFALLLLATVGMMFLVSSEEVLMIFASLELTSLSLYILTAFNKRDRQSAEAALKYFLFGGMAAAFTLFGLSLLYGLSGETNLVRIAAKLGGQSFEPLLAVALVMVAIGFGFKIAAVPFHLWAPDTYQAAPIPSAAFIASGSKVASFFVFGKVMMVGFAGQEGSGGWRHFQPGWVPVLAIMAAASMVLGNLAALAQGRVRRLLAYSAIAHAGYLLLGLLVLGHAGHRAEGMTALVYYLATYGLTTIGAFGVVAVVDRQLGADRLQDFAGLARRSPSLALCLMVFMLSLAGIPPLAGFFGKFYVFTAAVAAEPEDLALLWLVILAIAMSAVSLYYYLQVLKQAYVVAASTDGAAPAFALTERVALGLLALAILALGIAPGLLLDRLAGAVALAGL